MTTPKSKLKSSMFVLLLLTLVIGGAFLTEGSDAKFTPAAIGEKLMGPSAVDAAAAQVAAKANEEKAARDLQNAALADYLGFYLLTSHPSMPASVGRDMVQTLVAALSSKGEGEARAYAIALSHHMRLDVKRVKAEVNYSWNLFDASAAQDLTKLCGATVTKESLKDASTQIRFGICYLDALTAATGSSAQAAAQLDSGRGIAKLLKAQKEAGKANASAATAKSRQADIPELLRAPIQGDSDLAAVETYYGISADARLHETYGYAVDQIGDKLMSTVRRAVLSASLARSALSVMTTAEESKSFVDLIGSISGYKSGRTGGLTGLSMKLASFAARACGFQAQVTEEDLQNEQSQLLLSACLYRATLARFGHDYLLAAAAYKDLVAAGKPGNLLAGAPIRNQLSLALVAEYAPTIGKGDAELAAENVLNEIAEIVKTPLKPSLSRSATFAMLARIATTMYPDSTKGQTDWFIVLAMETKYDGRLSSPAGARGIGQLIPSFAKDFGSSCGMTRVDQSDVDNDATNAVLSACYFRRMVAQHDGLVTVALAAYNAGLYSQDVKNIQNLSSMSNEPANYVARYSFIKEALEQAEAKRLAAGEPSLEPTAIQATAQAVMDQIAQAVESDGTAAGVATEKSAFMAIKAEKMPRVAYLSSDKNQN